MTDQVLDVIGVGFGPANLALSVALDNRGIKAQAQYFEMKPAFSWQPEMMLQGSDIQHHPLRDLITPVNPQSAYSFVSYLHQSGRFFEFLNLGTPFPLRREFAGYVEWVASQFTDTVRFDTQVRNIDLVSDGSDGLAVEVTYDDRRTALARNIVIGPGRSRNIPGEFEPALGPRVFHLMDYLSNVEKLQAPGRIAVIGGSQSAVEILLDLDSRFPDATIEGITRKFGYRLKDTSPFTGEVYFPEFTNYYHGASWDSRLAMAAELRGTNYSSSDADVLTQLYLRRYESRLEGKGDHLNVRANVEIARVRDTGSGVELVLRDRHDATERAVIYDAVVLATGFLDFGTGGQRELCHPLLADLAPHYAFDPVHGFDVARDYGLRGHTGLPGVYLNGLCESTHGFGDAGSFSLLSLRADEIARSIGARLGTEQSQARPEPIARKAQAVESFV